jgi:hypothetical protein
MRLPPRIDYQLVAENATVSTDYTDYADSGLESELQIKHAGANQSGLALTHP